MVVSYSMLEPESGPACECRYDPVHDRMDREDCFFHCDMEEEAPIVAETPPEDQTTLKKPVASATQKKENAA